jgi:pimeloyl-ACP methyl ester carboxylesterase
MIARLNEINVPTLLLWDRDDTVFPLEQSRVYLEAIPRSELIVYDHCGHFPMKELPDRTAGDFLAFISKSSQ